MKEYSKIKWKTDNEIITERWLEENGFKFEIIETHATVTKYRIKRLTETRDFDYEFDLNLLSRNLLKDLNDLNKSYRFCETFYDGD